MPVTPAPDATLMANRMAAQVPGGGRGLVLPTDGTTRALATAWLRYLQLTAQAFNSLGPVLTDEQRAVHRRTVDLLARLRARQPKALLGCFASPTIGTPLHCLPLRGALPEFADRIDSAAARVVPHLLLELALRGLLDEGTPIDWPIADVNTTTLSTLALGLTLRPPAATAALRFENGRLTALAPDGAALAVLCLSPELAPTIPECETDFTLTRSYHRVGRVTRLALVEHNPIAAFEAHPDKDGNHIDLGGRPPEEWVRMLEDAFALIEAACPDVHAEMQLMLHEVVPVGYHAERHLSASYREAIGTVYLTLHGNVMTMAEALIHEFQHNKMNVAAYSAEFLRNPFEPRYPSPVRPDPRPLWGILLAVHAFLPVAVLYRRMRAAGHPLSQRPDFERRLSEIDLKNHEGMEMLRLHAEWLPAGRALMDELEALERAHMAERASAGLALVPTEVHLA